MQSKYFGLDVGSLSIKAVWLDRNGKKTSLMGFGEVAAPPKGIFSENEMDHRALATAIVGLLNEAKIRAKQAVISLPETSVVTKVIEMPLMADNEVASAIRWEAEQYIPWPITSATLDWQILKRGEEKMDILLVASPTALIEKFVKVLKMARLEPVAVETDIIAEARALTWWEENPTSSMIVNIGALNTDLCIIDNGVFLFTRAVTTGGVALTRAVSQELNLEFHQAEEYKKTYGLNKEQLSGKVYGALKPITDVLLNEIKRALEFYKEGNKNEPLRRLIVSGGSAKLPGLVFYLASELGDIEVQIADCWKNIEVPKNLETAAMGGGPSFVTAVGLSMKEV